MPGDPRNDQSTRHRAPSVIYGVVGVIGLALAVAIATGVVLRSTVPTVQFTPMQFDSTIWKSAEPEFSWDSIRLRMVDDLLSNQKLEGSNRERIVALIGEPDDTPYFKEYDMVYYLGQERSAFGIDSEWLVIRLRDDHIASEVTIVRD